MVKYTHSDFICDLTGAYPSTEKSEGINPVHLAAITGHLAKFIKESELPALLNHILADYVFPPKYENYLKAWRKLKHVDNKEYLAERAWEQVEKIKTGAYSVVFEDTKIQTVIKNNWRTWDAFYLAKSEMSKLVFVKRDFIAAYCLELECDRRNIQHEMLLGYHDISNLQNPFHKQGDTLNYIGTPENKDNILSGIERLQISGGEPKSIKQITENIMAGVKA